MVAFQAANPDKKWTVAVNQIVHQSNDRLAHDVEVASTPDPIIISSLRAPPKEMLDAIHSYGGIVLHDVISIRHAKKALEAGVDGLILVASGAGGHAGTLSPFALVGEVRKFFDGPLALSGSIATGDAVLAAQAMGADFAYIGSRWLATRNRTSATATATPSRFQRGRHRLHELFTGVHGNYLKKSIEAADSIRKPCLKQTERDEFRSGSAKAWRDIWGAGQGVGLMDDVPSVEEMVARLKAEYDAARARLKL